MTNKEILSQEFYNKLIAITRSITELVYENHCFINLVLHSARVCFIQFDNGQGCDNCFSLNIIKVVQS